ncbi:hypothetical protein NPIL_398241 [Nephila pilipes]|uniref:Uncharacterized protein n=1 Tax=Nephila pilipes TaxID=299642 RepID=A0A8X6M730_NEPPI|nr:hypothetical protein NPIL_398241 [Nephila pilipes]
MAHLVIQWNSKTISSTVFRYVTILTFSPAISLEQRHFFRRSSKINLSSAMSTLHLFPRNVDPDECKKVLVEHHTFRCRGLQQPRCPREASSRVEGGSELF